MISRVARATGRPCRIRIVGGVAQLAERLSTRQCDVGSNPTTRSLPAPASPCHTFRRSCAKTSVSKPYIQTPLPPLRWIGLCPARTNTDIEGECMDGQRFDDLTRLVASGVPRRRVLGMIGGGLAAISRQGAERRRADLSESRRRLHDEPSRMLPGIDLRLGRQHHVRPGHSGLLRSRPAMLQCDWRQPAVLPRSGLLKLRHLRRPGTRLRRRR